MVAYLTSDVTDLTLLRRVLRDEVINLWLFAAGRNVDGTGGDDRLAGNGGAEAIEGFPGDDILHGGDGDDVLLGGAGNDEVRGNPGADLLLGNIGDDRLIGFAGDDLMVGGDGVDDLFFGGAGTGVDTAFVTAAGTSNFDILHGFVRGEDHIDLRAALGGFDPTQDAIGDFLAVRHFDGRPTEIWLDPDGGGEHIDPVVRLKGDFADVTIAGLIADGTLIVADDGVSAAPPAEPGEAEPVSGDGLAIMRASLGDGHVDDFLAGLTDQRTGAASADTILGTGKAERFEGRGGDDTVRGRDNDDLVVGDTGDDKLVGNDGADILLGGEGDDALHGLGGDDVLVGGAGLDRLYLETANGTGGRDTVVVTAAGAQDLDILHGFAPGRETIDLSPLLGGYDPGTDARADFVRLRSPADGRAEFWVDPTGGGSGFDEAARLFGNFSQLLLDDLLGTGSLRLTANGDGGTDGGTGGRDSRGGGDTPGGGAPTTPFGDWGALQAAVRDGDWSDVPVDRRWIGDDRANDLDGGAERDLLVGGAAVDHLAGHLSHDIHVGGSGSDWYYGSKNEFDADVYFVDGLNSQRTQLHNYTYGDIIDVHAVIPHYDPARDDINDYLKIGVEEDGRRTTLRVDPDGGGIHDGEALIFNSFRKRPAELSVDKMIADGVLVVDDFAGGLAASAPSVVDVRDFGARPNDGNDDAAALQAAFDTGMKYGAEVHLPAGTFHFGEGLDLDSVVVRGAGFGTVLMPTTRGDSAITLSGDDVELHDMTRAMPFPREDIDKEGHMGVRVDAATDFVVEGVMVEGGQFGIHVSSDRFNAHGVIRDNIVLNTGADGIRMTDGATAVLVENNWVQNAGDDGISVVGYIDRGWWPSNIVIRENLVIDNDWGRNIAVAGGRQVAVVDNFVSDNLGGGGGIIVASPATFGVLGSRDVLISGNVVQDTGSWRSGHGNISVAGSAESSTGIVVDGNVSLAADKHGLMVAGTEIKEVDFIDNVVGGADFLTLSVTDAAHDVTERGTVGIDIDVPPATWKAQRVDEPYNVHIRDVVWGTRANQIDPSDSPRSEGRIAVDRADYTPQVQRGDDGADRLTGGGRDEVLMAKAGNDVLGGGGGDDTLLGGRGRDRLDGGGGRDLLAGQRGDDTLRGDGGDDVLVGSEGVDDVYGGAGADRFQLANWNGGADRDVVHDFGRGADVIDLRDYLKAYRPRFDLDDFLLLDRLDADSFRLQLDPAGDGRGETAFVVEDVTWGGLSSSDLVASGDVLI